MWPALVKNRRTQGIHGGSQRGRLARGTMTPAASGTSSTAREGEGAQVGPGRIRWSGRCGRVQRIPVRPIVTISMGSA